MCVFERHIGEQRAGEQAVGISVVCCLPACEINTQVETRHLHCHRQWWNLGTQSQSMKWEDPRLCLTPSTHQVWVAAGPWRQCLAYHPCQTRCPRTEWRAAPWGHLQGKRSELHSPAGIAHPPQFHHCAHPEWLSLCRSLRGEQPETGGLQKHATKRISDEERVFECLLLTPAVHVLRSQDESDMVAHEAPQATAQIKQQAARNYCRNNANNLSSTKHMPHKLVWLLCSMQKNELVARVWGVCGVV